MRERERRKEQAEKKITVLKSADELIKSGRVGIRESKMLKTNLRMILRGEYSDDVLKEARERDLRSRNLLEGCETEGSGPGGGKSGSKSNSKNNSRSGSKLISKSSESESKDSKDRKSSLTETTLKEMGHKLLKEANNPVKNVNDKDTDINDNGKPTTTQFHYAKPKPIRPDLLVGLHLPSFLNPSDMLNAIQKRAKRVSIAHGVTVKDFAPGSPVSGSRSETVSGSTSLQAGLASELASELSPLKALGRSLLGLADNASLPGTTTNALQRNPLKLQKAKTKTTETLAKLQSSCFLRAKALTSITDVEAEALKITKSISEVIKIAALAREKLFQSGKSSDQKHGKNTNHLAQPLKKRQTSKERLLQEKRAQGLLGSGKGAVVGGKSGENNNSSSSDGKANGSNAADDTDVSSLLTDEYYHKVAVLQDLSLRPIIIYGLESFAESLVWNNAEKKLQKIRSSSVNNFKTSQCQSRGFQFAGSGGPLNFVPPNFQKRRASTGDLLAMGSGASNAVASLKLGAGPQAFNLDFNPESSDLSNCMQQNQSQIDLKRSLLPPIALYPAFLECAEGQDSDDGECDASILCTFGDVESDSDSSDLTGCGGGSNLGLTFKLSSDASTTPFVNLEIQNLM